MDQQLHQIAEKVNKKKHRRKFWQRFVSVLGCIVMFCTTYALILPAITMEKEAFCGLEAHEHDDSCYVLPDSVLICGQTGSQAHSHDDSCFAADGSVVCAFAEPSGHVHTDMCYVIQGGHTHSESCYTVSAGDLICTLAEDPGHTHSQSCYTTGALVCTEEGDHVHEDACYEQLLQCQIPECEGHTHSQTCYQQISTLTCGLEETPGEPVLTCSLEEAAVHIHTDACYAPAQEPVLTCQKEIHTHTLACYANPNADLEDASMWESTFAHVELKDIWAEDLLAIADSQLGYHESIDNYLVDEADGETTKGYTRYGAWYGSAYGDWCAMFVSFCLNYANIPQEAIPYEASCPRWVAALQDPEVDLFRHAAEYTPVPGDIIFFDWEGDDSSDHVGIVAELIPATEDQPVTVKTIEGNSADCVRYVSYALADPQICGYGQLPVNPQMLSGSLAEQELTAVIYTDNTYTTAAVEDTTLITVSGLLPVGAEARAYPVELEAPTIDGQSVLAAYDITIFDADGNLFEQALPEHPLTVSIRPAGWNSQDSLNEEADYNAYYIPEEGDPEAIDTTTGDDAVSFQTDHFSTYALTVSGTLSTVYLNGTNGNDSNTGTSANSAVKTVEKALALVKPGGTVYISGTVTVSDTQNWDVDSQVTLKRYSSFTGPLITVVEGGNLTLSNITINGGSSKPSDSNIATNSTYASGSAKAPLIVVNTSGRLTLQGGVVLEYNSNQPTISSNKFVENGYVGLGGAVYCNGSLTMNGGLIQYCEAQCGGGVYVENGSFYLNGGTIDHNYARDIVSYRNRVENYHKNAGGGVYVGDNATMTMTGGLISYNQSSREGGGISLGWLNRSNNAGIEPYITTFTMNGGTLDHNYAVSTGGGLNITAGRQAFINAGYITYNTADGDEYQDSSDWVSAGNSTSVFSGGGIYIDAAQWSNYDQNNHDGVPGKAVINRVMVTSNTSSSYGGGLAACGTSINFIYGDATNGTAFYGNTASTSSYSKEMYIEDGQLTNSSTVLGGGSYGWSSRTVYYGTGYTNSLTGNSSAIVKAKELATVFIMNNTGYLGGGIGCNGLIEIGGEKEESTYINIKKIWEDDGTVVHPEYIEVQILQDGEPYGAPIRIYRSYDENGQEIWPTFYVGGLPSGHTYTIEEIGVPGYEASIAQTGKDFVITNKQVGFQVVKKWMDESGNPVTEDLPDSITVQLYQNGVAYGDPVELNAANGWKYTWPEDLPEKDASGNSYTYTVEEIHVPDGFYIKEITGNGKAYTVTNVRSNRTCISVEKKWAVAEGEDHPASVQVQLLQNGAAYRDSVSLDAGNNWFYKWDDLPVKTTAGHDAVYTVQEIPVAGYDSSIEQTLKSEEGTTLYSWAAADTLENGKTYLLVSSSGALAGSGTSGLAWLGVSSNLSDGSLPDDAALWTYNSSKLQNGDGKYLVIKSSGSWNKTYTFATGSSGSDITFSNGKLSAYSSGTRYFSGISNTGSGSTVTSSNSAVTFTAYERTSEVIPGTENTHFIITNTRRPSSLELNVAKVSTGTDSSGNPTLIAGAELQLYKVDETAADLIPGTDVCGALIESWTSEKTSADNPEGIKAFELYSGTYYLVESKAPDGHLGLAGPIIFQVDAEAQTVEIISYPGYEDMEVTEGKLLVYNAVMVTLPETGGPGTTPYTLGGLLLIAAAGVLLLYNPGKRGRGRGMSP